VVGAPYAAALRLGAWWLANEADVSGRATLAGIHCLEDEPLIVALDVVYSLLLDEFDPPRRDARVRLDKVLAVPLDPQEAEEQRRATWGLDEEAVAMAAVKDRIFGDG
jgi:hypothetical protein